MLRILDGQLTLPGVTLTQLQRMVTSVMQQVGEDLLPLTNCTADGNFAPVQCRVNVTTREKTCRCVNKEGAHKPSNVEAYPGFPPCTGMRERERGEGRGGRKREEGEVVREGGREGEDVLLREQGGGAQAQ